MGECNEVSACQLCVACRNSAPVRTILSAILATVLWICCIVGFCNGVKDFGHCGVDVLDHGVVDMLARR